MKFEPIFSGSAKLFNLIFSSVNTSSTNHALVKKAFFIADLIKNKTSFLIQLKGELIEIPFYPVHLRISILIILIQAKESNKLVRLCESLKYTQLKNQ